MIIKRESWSLYYILMCNSFRKPVKVIFFIIFENFFLKTLACLKNCAYLCIRFRTKSCVSA